MIFSRLVLVLVALFACASVVVEGRLREGECEVCIKVTDRFMVAIKEANAKSLEDIETVMTKQCSKKHTKDSQERRFCYYIGGTDDAATGFLRALSQPLSNGLPSEKVCERLKSKDAQICELQYHKAIDIETMDLSKLRVKQLKKILQDWDEDCKGCADKSDFIRMIERVKDKHAPKKEL